MNKDRIQFIGHSCLWLTIDGLDFIVDANFSPKLVGFFKRHSSLGIDLLNLPDVSGLLVTHAHYDHLDLFTYKYFSQDKPMITPPGLGHLIRRFLHNPIVELKPGTEHSIGSVRIIAVPTKHFGFRVSGLRYTKCNGYILQGKKHTFYFPGDTAYGDHFEKIGKQFDIDVACLPIGSYNPRWIMKSKHLNPDEALLAFEQLGAKKIIPIHWGSFKLSLEPLGEPLKKFKAALESKSLKSRAVILNPGESLSL